MKEKKQNLIRKVNAQLIHHLKFEEEQEIELLDFNRLANPARFDVIIKYLYAKAYRCGYDLKFATNAYREHLKAWGGFVENDLTGKDSFEKYLIAFNQLLDSVAADGFDREKSYLPVGEGGIVIDGAHRSAACLAYQSDPTVVKFEHAEAIYDSKFFKKLGVSQKYLDAAAIEYAKLNTNTYMVCLFPIGGHKRAQVENVLDEYGVIVYDQKIPLFNFGPVNAIAQMYKGEHWLGGRDKGWPGALEHAKNKFTSNNPLLVYLFECPDILLVKEVKAKIRALFSVGNNSVHINDSHEETVRLAEQFFNENTIHLFNHGDLSKRNRVFELHELFKKDITKKAYDKEMFCIDSSSVLSLYGLRESNDYDYLVYKDEKQIFSDPLINNHNHEIRHYGEGLRDLIFDPSCYLYYDGIKYSSLNTVLKMKNNRAEEKDLKDIELVRSLIQNVSEPVPWKPLQGKIKIITPGKLMRIVVSCIPSFILPFATFTFRKLRSIKEFLPKIPDYFRIGDIKMQYQGFWLFYSVGTSLIDRVRNGQIYEPDVTTATIRELQKCETPVVMDIGANIGLMSLNILKFYPCAKIYAFEPGPHQRELFSKTIEANSLQKKVKLYDTALSDSNGTATFSVHSTAHASGDGFKDTNRAGTTKNISVNTQKLDDWWLLNGRPKVNFVKIDTEGAELLVLRGGVNFLDKVKPTLLLELTNLNLRVYDYDHLDILEFLEKNGYILKTLAGSKVNRNTIEDYMAVFGEFIAVPINTQ